MRTVNVFLLAVALGLATPAIDVALSARVETPKPQIEVVLDPRHDAPRADARDHVLPVPRQHRLAQAYEAVAADGFDPEDAMEAERITGYNPLPGQTNANPAMSSCGPTLDQQVALSRDLFFEDGEKIHCGREASVYVLNRGEVERYDLVVNDTMAPRFERTVDLMVHGKDVAAAERFGVKSGLLILHD